MVHKNLYVKVQFGDGLAEVLSKSIKSSREKKKISYICTTKD